MGLNLVSYSGRDKFELDVSKLDPKDRSVKERLTFFFSKNTTWDMSDAELKLLNSNKDLKEYSRWCHVHKTNKDPFKKLDPSVRKANLEKARLDRDKKKKEAKEKVESEKEDSKKKTLKKKSDRK